MPLTLKADGSLIHEAVDVTADAELLDSEPSGASESIRGNDSAGNSASFLKDRCMAVYEVAAAVNKRHTCWFCRLVAALHTESEA